MELKKYTSAAIALVSALSLASCSKEKEKQKNEESVVQTSSSVTSDTTTTTTEPMTTLTEVSVTAPKIKKQDFYSLCEAEDAKLSDGLRISFEMDDYSGNGYVTDFKDGSKVTFKVKSPSDQHYDLSFSIASANENECTLTLEGEEISTFRSQAGGQFTYITVYGVFLPKGTSEIVLTSKGGNMALDYMKVSESSTHASSSGKAEKKPVGKKASSSSAELKKLLADNFGKYTITGQYVSDNTDAEIELIYRTTGKFPAIRFSDMDMTDDTADTDAIAAWHEKGGIACVSWYWKAPSDKSGVRTEDTDFSLKEAVTDEDIAELAPKKLDTLADKNKIPKQCRALVDDIDKMAEKLKVLADKDIPIMWRPLPEGSGDWYWWGADGAEAYKWLWELMYKRMTEYHKLNNLIWVWNGQSKDFLVDKAYFDIAAADLYISGEKDYGDKFSEVFAAVKDYAGNDKIIGISECGSVPDIDTCFRDKAVWSFFGLMGGEYITDTSGKLSEKYTSKDALIKAYNSEGTLTLEELEAPEKDEKKK